MPHRRLCCTARRTASALPLHRQLSCPCPLAAQRGLWQRAAHRGRRKASCSAATLSPLAPRPRRQRLDPAAPTAAAALAPDSLFPGRGEGGGSVVASGTIADSGIGGGGTGGGTGGGQGSASGIGGIGGIGPLLLSCGRRSRPSELFDWSSLPSASPCPSASSHGRPSGRMCMSLCACVTGSTAGRCCAVVCSCGVIRTRPFHAGARRACRQLPRSNTMQWTVKRARKRVGGCGTCGQGGCDLDAIDRCIFQIGPDRPLSHVDMHLVSMKASMYGVAWCR